MQFVKFVYVTHQSWINAWFVVQCSFGIVISCFVVDSLQEWEDCSVHSSWRLIKTSLCIPCTHSCLSKWLIHFTAFLAHILVRQSDSYISLSCLPIFWSVTVTPTFHWFACPYSGPSQWHILVRQSNSDILLHFLHMFWSVKVAHTDPRSDSYISLHSLHTFWSVKAKYISLHSLHTFWSIKVTDTFHCIPYTHSGPLKWLMWKLVLSTHCSTQLLGPEHRLFSPVTAYWADHPHRSIRWHPHQSVSPFAKRAPWNVLLELDFSSLLIYAANWWK